VVARLPEARPGDKKWLLSHEVEQLVVEAKRLGADMDEVIDAVATQWARLERPAEVHRK
jgi:hypothetical protein